HHHRRHDARLALLQLVDLLLQPGPQHRRLGVGQRQERQRLRPPPHRAPGSRRPAGRRRPPARLPFPSAGSRTPHSPPHPPPHHPPALRHPPRHPPPAPLPPPPASPRHLPLRPVAERPQLLLQFPHAGLELLALPGLLRRRQFQIRFVAIVEESEQLVILALR